MQQKKDLLTCVLVMTAALRCGWGGDRAPNDHALPDSVRCQTRGYVFDGNRPDPELT
jgi:hypothetical protein